MNFLGIIQFDRPAWLLLLPVAAALVVWIGRKSLSGMGTTTRRVALGIRLAVLALLIGAMAEPQFRREADSVSVSFVLDASRSLRDMQAVARQYIDESSRTARDKDQVALVTAARDAYVQALPRPVRQQVDVQDVGATDGTNLESAGRMAMAVMPSDAANRLVVISDGNETAGSLLAMAKSAQAAGVPIDVLPRTFSLDREVIFERLVTPATARDGEVVSLRLVVTATQRTQGRISLLMNEQEVDLDPETPGNGRLVELEQGTNVLVQQVALPSRGAVRFRALFEPLSGASGAVAGDTVTDNNVATAVTFVGGEGRALVVVPQRAAGEGDRLVEALRAADIQVDVRDEREPWRSLADLGVYEGLVLVNAAASDFSLAQQEEMRSYVQDLGGGLVMVGGPEAFGAGGWIGSPVADTLPIRLDPPNKRQMPRGALMLVMHSCEMPEGNFYGRRCAEAAIDALSSRDMAGIVEHNWSGGDGIVHPLSILGDKSAIRRAANAMTYGDAPSFVPMLETSYRQLMGVQAGQRHVIIISDGDPAPPSDALLQQFIAGKISISTVAVFPHAGPGSTDLVKMERIARLTGGTYHEITVNNQLNSLPQIFIKEAQTVKRSLIWEGEPFRPSLAAISEPMRGIGTPLPPITGYVVGAEREGGLAQVILRGQENDPVLAQWQFGLGRVIAFTSDATSRWATAWTQWPGYRAFWEQHLRWAMRPGTNQNVRVSTVDEGDKTRIVVEAAQQDGTRMDFLRWTGAAVGPDRVAVPVELRQTGPGRDEGLVPTAASGSYVVNLGYSQVEEGGKVNRGATQVAITRPFADEFRFMRDNSALLEQVAKLTGGRVLTGNPATDQVWDPKGLTMPVSLRPIWLEVALIAIACFLLDVAVRRVRMDVLAVARAIRRGLGAGSSAATGQIDSLRTARQRAQAQVAERQRGFNEPGRPIGERISAPTAAPGDRAGAGVKFEATAQELAQARSAGSFADQVLAKPSEPQRGPASTPGQGGQTQGQPGAPGDGMSRLLKAKQRAQGDLNKDGGTPPGDGGTNR
ncbi:MAG: glutamine amidotransferase [bacterium]